MEPHEVRIGNYVLVPPTESKVLLPSVPKQIKGITSQGEIEIAKGQFDIMIRIPARHCKGIKLRTIHLEFLGFRKISESQYLHNVPDVQLTDCNEYFMCNLNENIKIRLDYIHQLQNLFAEITMNSYIPDFNSFFKKQGENIPYQVV